LMKPGASAGSGSATYRTRRGRVAAGGRELDVICARCDKPIRPGEPYGTHDEVRPTGPGLTLYFHKRRCRKVPTQTSPSGRGR
jgi:hypothetical protein